ncbi:MAG TPA: 4Fe-4S dicluster domain-containing protein, partial [Armatimonadetes bacterium]|nr:4Fe-4S dicluster domain-containing protein [Armatimonadota bacterium]
MDCIVRINEDNCVTCHPCEVACIVAHSRYGDPIKAYRLENPRPLPMSLLVHRGPVSLPVICRHCEHPFCVDACLSGALSKEADGAVRINVQKCIGCASCVMACPFGAIRLRKDLPQPKALKCDLCPERDLPACVQACPNRALTFEVRSTVDSEARRCALEVVGEPASPYVIIGGGIAAAAGVRGIRSADPDGDIYLIAPEVIGCYSKALLAHFLIDGEHHKLLYREPDYFAQYNVEWLQGRRATAIDVERNRVQLDDGSQLTYGSLLICTGGRPFVPPMDGSDKA